MKISLLHKMIKDDEEYATELLEEGEDRETEEEVNIRAFDLD